MEVFERSATFRSIGSDPGTGFGPNRVKQTDFLDRREYFSSRFDFVFLFYSVEMFETKFRQFEFENK